jgi:PKD repeat protein
MKTVTFRKRKPIRKYLIGTIMLLCIFTLSSYRSMACSASFGYTPGLNGHSSFNSTSTGFGSGVRYSWNAGDGSGWQSGNVVFNHTYITNNTFTVKLAANDSTCYDTATMVITISNVSSPCTLHSSYTYTVAPYGFVNFTSTSTGTASYTQYYWKPGDSSQTIHGASTFTHQYAHPGMYLAWLTLIDTGSNYCTDSIENWVDVTTVDTNYCHIHANFSYTAGSNGQITFTNTSTGASIYDSYSWSFGDTSGNSYGIGPVTHTYLFNGTYNVMLVVRADTSMGGCYDSITIPVTVTNACNLQASFVITYDTNNDNGQVLLTSTTNGANLGSQYYWTPGDGSPTVLGNDTITFWYPFNGTYTASLVVVNSSGCKDSTSMLVTVTEKDSLQACFTYVSDTLHSGGYIFTSCSRGVNGDTYYKWTPGDGDPSDSGLGMTSYTHIYSSNGPYSATLTIWYTVLPTIKHRNSATNGRFDLSSYTLVIHVSTATGIQSLSDNSIYTVYPNPNDGSFHIAVNGLSQDKNAEIRISDMMGQVIYQSNAAVNGGNSLSDVTLHNAANGVYLLQVITNGNTYTTRIAIQK